MIQIRSLNRVGAAASLVMLQAAASAAPLYQITSLGSGVIPNRISESGTVVGSLFYQRPIAWRDGATDYLDVGPGTSANWASDITASGLIVGSANSNAAVWQGGQWVALPGANSYSHAWAVNNSGLIGGEADDQAVIWRNGLPEVLSAPPGHVKNTVVDISAGGTVVGLSWNLDPVAWRWVDGETRLLDQGQAIGSEANGINDLDSIVGNLRFSPTRWTAVRWDGDSLTLLDSLSGALLSSAHAINNHGVAVGSSVFSFYTGPESTHDERATLWEGVAPINLNDQLINPDGWILSQALGINDKGQIIGRGWQNGVQTAYLLTPVPEADSLLMLGFGLPLAWSLRRRCIRART